MLPRISYWSGWLDPQMVAVSKELFQLQRRFPGSWVFGVSTHYTCRFLPRRRAFGVHRGGFPIFRLLIPLIERWFDISHIYTSLDDWHFVQTLGQRPVMLTLTEAATEPNPRVPRKIAHVVAESERLAADAIAAGVPPERISVIYPGVDLGLFRSSPPPPLPWKCFFASSPESLEELRSKGVDLLLDLARARPELQITIAWRPFGRSSERALAALRDAGLPNVHVKEGRLANIHDLYRDHHFTIAPFRTTGKPCPNSILEGLASGRPAIVSDLVHVAGLLEKAGAAVSFQRSGASLAEAFDRLTQNYAHFQANARPCAERYFDVETTVARYRNLYAQLIASSAEVGDAAEEKG